MLFCIEWDCVNNSKQQRTNAVTILPRAVARCCRPSFNFVPRIDVLFRVVEIRNEIIEQGKTALNNGEQMTLLYLLMRRLEGVDLLFRPQLCCSASRFS